MSDLAILRGALLWARNCIDLPAPEFREAILKRLDDVLDASSICTSDMRAFKAAYPSENYAHIANEGVLKKLGKKR